ncbi:MAG: hypothetical protein AB1450_07245 [Pseudomonadota bacterium]
MPNFSDRKIVSQPAPRDESAGNSPATAAVTSIRPRPPALTIGRRAGLSALVLICLASLPVQAARYELKDGHKYAICHDYVAALNAAKREFPMACERHFPPEFEKFSKPKWTPLDPMAQPESFYRDIYYVWYGYRKEPTEAGWQRIWNNYMKPALDAGTLQLDRARVDVVATGAPVTLLRFAYQPCKESMEWFEKSAWSETYRYFVLDEKTGRLDKGFAGLTSKERGLFYYRGRVYMDSFSGLPLSFLRTQERGELPDGHLTVVEPHSNTKESGGYEFGGNRQICVVKVYYELPGTEMEDKGRNEP